MANGKFSPEKKNSGDLIKSADWNAAMQEVVRLEQAKVNRKDSDTIQGPLTIEGALQVKGNVGIGTTQLQEKLEVDGNIKALKVIATGIDIEGAAMLGYESNIADFGSPLKSGFYQNGGSHIAGDVPDTSHGWTHLITARHSNTRNNHQLQIASSYSKNDRLFFRKIQAGLEASNPDWNEVATRGINTFVGNQIINGELTVTGVMSGAANGYQKAQFTMSGGGIVTWEGVGGRLKWTRRFIAISMERSISFPVGYIDINQPTSDIPAAQVYDGNARSANADGVILNAWEALYAVHTVGGNQSAISFQIVRYNQEFNAPSNWLLLAVVNRDDNTVKLGTGEIISVQGSNANFRGAITVQQTHTIKIGVPSPGKYGNDGIRGEPNLWLDAAGTVFIKQGFQARGMDVAERFKTLGHVEAGWVVVMDEQEKAVSPCNSAYDSCVVGIVSAEPAFILGIEQEHRPIALCGRVPCYVDADIAPIAVGDLLTTSPTKGHAQKVLEPERATGTIIGKALESLGKGKGQITVLVILQ